MRLVLCGCTSTITHCNSNIGISQDSLEKGGEGREKGGEREEGGRGERREGRGRRKGGEEEGGNVVRLWIAGTHLLLGERRGGEEEMKQTSLRKGCNKKGRNIKSSTFPSARLVCCSQ